MVNNIIEIESKINFICKNMEKPFPFPKIYIDNKNATHLNLLSIPYENIKGNSRFINYNSEILKKIVACKNECNLESLYIEMDFNVIKVIDLPSESSLEEDYFFFIENQSLIKKMLLNKNKLNEDEIVKEVIIFIKLFEYRKAMKIIQYIICKKIFCDSISKKIFDGYIEILDREKGFYKCNNFRYIRNIVLSKCSLDKLNMEFPR